MMTAMETMTITTLRMPELSGAGLSSSGRKTGELSAC